MSSRGGSRSRFPRILLILCCKYINCTVSGQGDITVINQVITNLSPCVALILPRTESNIITMDNVLIISS